MEGNSAPIFIFLMNNADLFLPGETICEDMGYITGHGTQKRDGKVVSTVYGHKKLINKLIIVSPFLSLKYVPEVGDVVVGRVTGVGSGKWKISLNCRMETSLSLSSVLRPTTKNGPLKTLRDVTMDEIFDINDVIVAEVQKINRLGGVSLHARSEKYTKLLYGVLIELPPMLIPRMKTCFPEGSFTRVVIGMNGYVFVGPIQTGSPNFIEVANVVAYLKDCEKNMEMLCEYSLGIMLGNKNQQQPR